jgi:hypothetical protein
MDSLSQVKLFFNGRMLEEPFEIPVLGGTREMSSQIMRRLQGLRIGPTLPLDVSIRVGKNSATAVPSEWQMIKPVRSDDKS